MLHRSAQHLTVNRVLGMCKTFHVKNKEKLLQTFPECEIQPEVTLCIGIEGCKPDFS